MAIDKRLKIYDDQGNEVDYDILATDVKFSDGEDLPTKMAELEDEIHEGGSGDGTVTGVKVGSTTYEPTDGVVDLSTPFGGKVDKITGYGLSKNDYTDADKTAVATIPSKANDADVVKTISVNGTAQQKTNGNVNIVVPSGGLTESDISVETQGDGTVDINVGNDTYTVNLNHTHEDMAKIVKCTEATLPQTLENDTIYVQVDNATTPSEIESLWLFGLEFTGGGFAPGTPRIVHPSGNTQINIGDTVNGSVSYTLNIKAKDITQPLIVEFGSGSTGYSFDTSDLPTGVTYDSNTGQLTITVAAATSINGVDIPVVYTGSDTDEDAEGTIGISSSSVDGINVELSLIVNKVSYEQLTAIKLTGTQWLQTDFVPTPNTDVEMKLKFTETSRSWDTTEKGYYFLTCYTLQSSQKQYSMYLKEQLFNNPYTEAMIASIVTTSTVKDFPLPRTSVVLDNSKFSYSHDGLMTFVAGENGTVYSVQGNPVSQQTDPLTIGFYHSTSGTDSLFTKFILTIYELKITDNGSVVRDYKPVRRDGIPGLYDELTGHFMSSKTSTAVEAVTLES